MAVTNSSSNRSLPPASAAAPTAAGGDSKTRGEFWAQLKIEVGTFYRFLPTSLYITLLINQPISPSQIDPQYAPEWHPESSEASVIPADISESPSETDTTSMTDVVERGGEGFALPPARLPPKPEPRIAKWTGMGLSGALVLLGLAHQAVQLAMFAQLRLASSWWAGLLCVVVGAFGLSPWSCLHAYHDALVIIAILVNAVAAVFDMRTQAMLREPSLHCGGADEPIVAMTVGEWCALDERRGGSGRYSCGCIIPGAEPGATDSCLAFHSLSSPGGCDAGAHTLTGLVSASAILSWMLAVTCLVLSVVRVVSTCYQQRRCAVCLKCRRLQPKPNESSVPPYLRNSTQAVIPMGGNGRAIAKERREGKQQPGHKPPPAYWLRDCPGGQV